MVPFYNDQERLRLKAKPGLTGWAQVNGRNALPYHERLKLDTWYVEHWSIWLDMLIFVETIPAMTNRGGLYQEDARPWEKRPEAGGE